MAEVAEYSTKLWCCLLSYSTQSKMRSSVVMEEQNLIVTLIWFLPLDSLSFLVVAICINCMLFWKMVSEQHSRSIQQHSCNGLHLLDGLHTSSVAVTWYVSILALLFILWFKLMYPGPIASNDTNNLIFYV